MTFIPYRKPRGPVEPPKIDKERAEFTMALGKEIQRIILSYDLYPEHGHITIRDADGIVWELEIKRSDRRILVCE